MTSRNIMNRRNAVKRNPPSPGFERIGNGAFATAYKHETHVELIVKLESDFIDMANEAESHGGVRDRYGRSYLSVYDMSREAMIYAREIAPDNLKKFLPEITRKRVDFDNYGNEEFVYEMPFYDDYDDYEDTMKPANRRQMNDLEFILWKSIKKIYHGSGYSIKLKYSDEEYCGLARIDGGELDNLAPQNLSSHTDGTVIYRDPLVCLFFPHDAVRLFAGKFK